MSYDAIMSALAHEPVIKTALDPTTDLLRVATQNYRRSGASKVSIAHDPKIPPTDDWCPPAKHIPADFRKKVREEIFQAHIRAHTLAEEHAKPPKPRSPRNCKACGVPHDTFTPGCTRCAARAHMRRRNARAQAARTTA